MTYVVVPTKSNGLAYLYSGGECDSLEESTERAAEKIVVRLIEKYKVRVDDVKFECIEKGLPPQEYHQPHFHNTGSHGKTISVDFMEILPTVVTKINIPITGIETMTMGSNAYTCLFAMQCLHGVSKMEWIIGDKCTSVPVVKPTLAKKAISILKPLYHFEIRDANYHSIVPISLDCSLQRESYLTVKDRVLGIKDNANPSPSLKEQGFVTPTGLLSQIPCSAIAPLPPKKAKNMRVVAPSPSSVLTLSLPMDLSMVFKHMK